MNRICSPPPWRLPVLHPSPPSVQASHPSTLPIISHTQEFFLVDYLAPSTYMCSVSVAYTCPWVVGFWRVKVSLCWHNGILQRVLEQGARGRELGKLWTHSHVSGLPGRLCNCAGWSGFFFRSLEQRNQRLQLLPLLATHTGAPDNSVDQKGQPGASRYRLGDGKGMKIWKIQSWFKPHDLWFCKFTSLQCRKPCRCFKSFTCSACQIAPTPQGHFYGCPICPGSHPLATTPSLVCPHLVAITVGHKDAFVFQLHFLEVETVPL